MGLANGCEIYVYVVWLPIFCVLCVDLKLEMYEMGMPWGCVVVEVSAGDGVWYVFIGKMVVAFRNASFQYSIFGMAFIKVINGEYACVGAILDLG